MPPGFWLHFVIGFATGVALMAVVGIALMVWLGISAKELAMLRERRGVER